MISPQGDDHNGKFKIRCKKDLENIEKHKHRELLIIPKKNFIDWYKYTRDQVREIEMKRKELGTDIMECPNCRETMEDYHVKEAPEQELWHLCPHCNLTFSHDQYDRFNAILMRAIHRKNKKGACHVKTSAQG